MRLVALLVAAGLVAGVATSFGQGPSSATVRGCVKKKGGAVRIAKRCKRGEARLSWNRRGPVGPTGASGAPGAGGATGAKGPAGDTGPASSFRFDDFDGMECDPGSGPSSVRLTYDAAGYARFNC